MKECKRVLHVVSSMNRGGAETMLMNLYRHIDREKLQFDFVCHTMDKCDFEDEIYKLGGKIYRIKSLGNSGVFSYISNLRTVIKENGPYLAIHSHTDMQAGIANIAAIGTGIPIRICHSHNTNWGHPVNIRNSVLYKLLKLIGRITATDFVACGIEAGEFFFGVKAVKHNKVKILNNGIDVEKFIHVNDALCNKLEKEFKIKENDLIIGHIGRFYEQKNHKFIIDIARCMKENNLNFKFILVGKGPLLESIKEKVYDMDLSENVIFLGVRTDIDVLLNLFDVLIFPSLYEGLPLTLIEAQAAGLPSVISDNITDELDLGLNLIHRLSLDDPLNIWINKLQKVTKREKKEDFIGILKDSCFNVQKNINLLYEIYNLRE